jgi:ubiquinone biosynthesis protein
LRHEARNQLFFNAQNPYPDQVFAPAIHEAYCGERVLVMERVHGRRVDEAATLLTREQAVQVAASGARSLLDQILVGGFFHADPHAGNVRVLPDGRLCLLDWGLAGHLTKRMRLALADLFIAAAKQDAEALVGIASTLADPSAMPDLRAMEREVTLALREHFNPSLPRQEIGRFILKLLHLFGQHGISLTRDYALMAKAVFATEEIARALDPEFDLAAAAAPVLKAAQGDRYRPRTLLREGLNQLRLAFVHLREIPAAIERVVRRVEAENLTVNLQHRGLEQLDDALNSASNRLTLAVILAALIVGSSLIVTTGIKPHILGYPALGIVGYILSAMLGLWIVVDILRHGRHR